MQGSVISLSGDSRSLEGRSLFSRHLSIPQDKLHRCPLSEEEKKWQEPLLLSFSRLVMSDSLSPCGLQHTRLPCPSPSPGVCSNSCPLSQWCHPTISFSVTPFSSCPQSFAELDYFPVNQLFASSGQSIGVSASASLLPVNIQGWFPLGLTGLISLLSKGLPDVFSSTKNWKHQFFSAQPPLWSNSYIHTWLL